MTFSRPTCFTSTIDMHGRRVAQFTCVECGQKADVTDPNGMPAEQLTKKIEQRSWIAPTFKRSNVFCPKCAGPQKKANNTTSKGSSIMAITTIKPSIEPRQPTADQRVKIRNLLDKSFDDAAGAYLDGMSDQRIAEMVDVPRLIVERLREAAYGPIKVDPVIAAMQVELDALKKAVEGQQAGLDSLKVKHAELSARLEKKLAQAA